MHPLTYGSGGKQTQLTPHSASAAIVLAGGRSGRRIHACEAQSVRSADGQLPGLLAWHKRQVPAHSSIQQVKRSP